MWYTILRNQKIKNKNKNIIISIDAEIAFNKIQHWLMIKISPEKRLKRNLSQHKKDHIH